MNLLKYITLYNRQIYLFGIIFLLVSLPFSIFTLSISIIFLTIHWIIEGNFKLKYQKISSNKGLILFLCFILIPLSGLFFTSNISYALKYIRIQLPIFILTLIIATTDSISKKELKFILHWFVAAVFVSTLISLSVSFNIINYITNDSRQLSLFISHVRFSLMIVLAISFLFYFFLQSSSLKVKISYFLVITYLCFFLLFILKSLTGIVILFILIVIGSSFFINKKIHSVWIKLVIYIGIIFFIFTLIYSSYNRFYNIKTICFNKLDSLTQNGNVYSHDTLNKQIENGHYVWIYICSEELKKEWNLRSNIAFEGKDLKGQSLETTLIRYLSSLGLKKDSVGISNLTKKDIESIESGKSNYIFKNKISLYPKIYEIFWEIDQLKKGGIADGHSLSMRFLFLKASFSIIKNNFWTGVGTGDFLDELKLKYQTKDFQIDPKYWMRPHNQFISFLLTFGIFGLIGFLFILIYPAILSKKFTDYYFVVFIIIIFLSMLNEDTLDTHTGATFFAVFYALFLFGIKDHYPIFKQKN